MQISFSNNRADFFFTLRKRVDAYFIDNKISKNANSTMIIKSIFILATFFCTYTLLVFGGLNGWISLALSGLLGFMCAMIGFNISHDAGHGSYSSNANVNKVLSYTFDMLGTSSFMWSVMHNIGHHTYTNIPEHDEDLEPIFFLRLNPSHKVYWIHRFQHFYATFFYAIASLNWVLLKDFRKINDPDIISKTNPKKRREEIRIMIIAKLIYYTTFIIIPLVFTSYTWTEVLGGFLLSHAIEGITLGYVFQLAHVVEELDFPIPDEKGCVENSWAIHQLHTTSDFSRNSALATFCFGGLNFQIEHHLFPRICHIHYPELSKIVEATAKEYGIPYHAKKTMWQALMSHFSLLKKIGHGEIKVTQPAHSFVAATS